MSETCPCCGQPVRFSKATRDAAVARVVSGETGKIVAVDMGISLPTLYAWCKKAGVSPPRPPRIDRAGRALEWLQMKYSGGRVTYAQIAKQVGRSAGYVRQEILHYAAGIEDYDPTDPASVRWWAAHHGIIDRDRFVKDWGPPE